MTSHDQMAKRDDVSRGTANDNKASRLAELLARAALQRPTQSTREQGKAPWDAFHNRYYEPVEKRAAEIYAAYVYTAGEKPVWVPHGNSLKQDEARNTARRELLERGHVPIVTKHKEEAPSAQAVVEVTEEHKTAARRPTTPEPAQDRVQAATAALQALVDTNVTIEFQARMALKAADAVEAALSTIEPASGEVKPLLSDEQLIELETRLVAAERETEDACRIGRFNNKGPATADFEFKAQEYVRRLIDDVKALRTPALLAAQKE